MAIPKSCTVEVGPPAPKGEGRARRNVKSIEALVASPEEGVFTVHDVIQSAIKRYGHKNAIGYRDTIKVHTEVKEVVKTVRGKEVKENKTWTLYEMSDYKYITYKQLGEDIKHIASGLIELGITSKDHLNIYNSTRPSWQKVALACASQSIAFATSYDSLGEDGLAHSINQPKARGIFTSASLLPTLTKVLVNTPTIEYVIYDDKVEDQGILDALKQAKDDLRVITLDELVQLGKDHPRDANPPAKAQETLAIVYTSGSSGTPKGVIVTNEMVAGVVASSAINVSDFFAGDNTKYLAYLPLAHVLEFSAELSMFYHGACVGYGSVKTLTDTSMRNSLGDLRAFRPTTLAGVPAVFELIRKGVEAKVRAGGAVKEAVFNGALSAKRSSRFLFGGITDAVVFNKVKEATGGKLKYAMNGGAGISRETQEFLDLAVIRVLGGYGLTETCGMGAVSPAEYYLPGAVGAIMPSVEIKLVDYPEAGYFSDNNPSQGEIYIRGKSVTPGYYEDDKQTKENIKSDGWLMTGDIGQWNENGTLSIIDRKKNLVKLAGGEYIALERLESVYRSCRLVANICVVADPSANKPAAVVFPHEANLRAFVAEKGIEDKNDDLKVLTASDKVAMAALAELNAVGKRAGFKPLEQLQAVVFTHEEWTPQSGLLTAAMKLQRKAIQDRYKDDIKKVYP